MLVMRGNLRGLGVRGLGVTPDAPVSDPRCPNPPEGFTWDAGDPAANIPGHWARLRARGGPTVGVPAPYVSGYPDCVASERDHRNDVRPASQMPQVSLVEAKDTLTALLKAIDARNQLELKAIAQSLGYSCNLAQCSTYTGGYQNITKPSELIPGSFEVLGVGFNVGEVGLTKSPKFERSYTPNAEQRRLVEYDVFKQSSAIGPKLIEAAIAAQINKPAPSYPGVPVNATPSVSTFVNKLSVRGAMGLVPDLVTALDSFRVLPLQPTADELTGEGGYTKWVKRGGFFIYRPLIDGTRAWWDGAAIGPMPCISVACKCGTQSLPGCIKSGIPTTGGQGGSSFAVYVTIDQAAPWQFHLRLVHNDPDWWSKLGYKLEGFMKALGNVFCTSQPVVQDQMGKLGAEKCVDKDGKKCTKGATGCTCIQPNAASTGSIGIANFMASKWCADWVAHYATDPATPIPPTPDVPLLPDGFGKPLIPLWLIGGFGLLTGALLFSRR